MCAELRAWQIGKKGRLFFFFDGLVAVAAAAGVAILVLYIFVVKNLVGFAGSLCRADRFGGCGKTPSTLLVYFFVCFQHLSYRTPKVKLADFTLERLLLFRPV